MTAASPRHHSAAAWRLASVVLAWLCFASGVLLAGWGTAWGAVFVWAPLAAVGLYLATALRLAILDMVAEFTYRERFGAFLVHVVAFFAPVLFLGLKGPAHALGALGALIAFHAATPSHYGRLLACSGALVVAAYTRMDQPPAGFGPIWALLALLTVRCLHVRFTLEEEGDARGPDMTFEVRQMLPAVGLPMLAGLLVFAAAAAFLEPRALSFRAGDVQSPYRPIGPVSSTSAFFDAAMVVVLVVVLLVLLNYLQSLLRNLKNGAGDEGVPLGGRARVLADALAAEDRLADEATTGARDRILRAFRRLVKGLASAAPRSPHETPVEYARRVARISERTELASAQASTFDVACYSPQDVTEQAAGDYEGYVASELELVRSRTSPQGNTPRATNP